MKLIIDIPRKVNEHIRSWYGHGYFPQNKEDRNIIAKAIYDSTPIPDNATNVLDAIKLEIKQEYDTQGDWSFNDGLAFALEIIDKYAKEI